MKEENNEIVSAAETISVDYEEILQRAVAVIENARTSVARHLATTASNTYWEIGKLLHEKKLESKHGSEVVKRLSSDLKERYPKMGIATLYYAQESVAKGWNRDLLLNALKLKMHETHALVSTDNNFSSTLPATQAQYANEVFRSSYNLGFLGVTEPILELELERRLVEKIKLFLLELGKGFTFIGNQHVLEYNGKEYRVDLLFFHRKLRSLVAIDLKIGEYKPEYAGKMNTYLSILDRIEKSDDENRSIGIILCAEKDNVEVALSLEDMGKPIGVADYQLIIPKEELQKTISAEIHSFELEQAVKEQQKKKEDEA